MRDTLVWVKFKTKEDESALMLDRILDDNIAQQSAAFYEALDRDVLYPQLLEFVKECKCKHPFYLARSAVSFPRYLFMVRWMI